MNVRYVRDDSVVQGLAPEDRAYRILDASDRLVGVVAGSGRTWCAGRISPLRGRPIIPAAMAESRDAAVRLLVEGRP